MLKRFDVGSSILTTCQVGAEAVLKQEVAREHPELIFAYSRPGFVTFKVRAERPWPDDFAFGSVFARFAALSLARITDVPSAEARQEVAAALAEHQPAHLHVFEVDRYKPGEVPPEAEPGVLAEAAKDDLRQGFAHSRLPASAVPRVNEEPAVGERVLDIVVLSAAEWWLALHRQTQAHSPAPGGLLPLTLPDEAPSRAYLKLEEAVARFGLRLLAGQTAVEVGSAPGGAAYALLRRGLNVVGIDPGEMAPIVAGHPRYRHISLPVTAVPRKLLPERVDWLLLDMNIEPRLALPPTLRLLESLRATLAGVVLTVKLNRWELAAEIPAVQARLRRAGLADVRAAQLASNRQEICVVGTVGRRRRPR